MSKPKGRRRLTCHHEAGHALVRWYFGHRTDRAVVFTFAEVCAGKLFVNRRDVASLCEGAVDGWDIHGYPYKRPLPSNVDAQTLADFTHDLEVSRNIELINCAAGIAAEAAYTHVATIVIMLTGGTGDTTRTDDIVAAWFSEEAHRQQARNLASQRAAALVRSKAGSMAIRAMADALMQKGEIKADEIAGLCREAYGGRQCEFGAWNAHWPPTLEQLRSGYIPD